MLVLHICAFMDCYRVNVTPFSFCSEYSLWPLLVRDWNWKYLRDFRLEPQFIRAVHRSEFFKQRMLVAVYWLWSLKIGQISCYVPLVQDYQHTPINNQNSEDLKNISLFLQFPLTQIFIFATQLCWILVQLRQCSFVYNFWNDFHATPIIKVTAYVSFWPKARAWPDRCSWLFWYPHQPLSSSWVANLQRRK